MQDKIYDPKKNTVLQYLNFVYLRIKEGIKIEDREYEDTYKYYVNYCNENDVAVMPFQMFYRELVKVGIGTTQYKYPDGRRVRRRVFKMDKLEKIFGFVANNTVNTSGTVTIGNDTFHIAIKLTRINKEMPQVTVE